jgi:uncharacterized protein DUF4262
VRTDVDRRRKGGGPVNAPETRAQVIAKLTACLEALGAEISLPDRLTARQRIAFLLGALGAADDALLALGNVLDEGRLIEDSKLLEEGRDHLDNFAKGYAAAADQLQASVAGGMIMRLNGYCDILRLPGFDYERRPLKSAAYHAMAGASRILASFGSPLEEIDGLIGQARGCLTYAGEGLDRTHGTTERREAADEEIAEWINQEAARHLEQIEKHGFYTQYVGGDPEPGAPQYAYTVGLSSQDAYGYEFAVSGLSPTTSHAVLWNLVRAFEPDDMVPADGLEVPEIVAGGNVRLRTASTAGEFWMIERPLGERSTVWQAVCPDDEGRFPGEAGYVLKRGRQHLL